jgi:hypothetical protein
MQHVIRDGFDMLLNVLLYVRDIGKVCLTHLGLQIPPQEKNVVKRSGGVRGKLMSP